MVKDLKNLKNFSKIFTATTWQILGKGVTAGVSFAVVILLGKFLGEAQYGDFAKAFALVEIFYIFSDFGLNAIFVKSIKEGGKENYFLGQLISLRLISSLFLIIVISLVVFLLPYDPETGSGFSKFVKLGAILASATILTYSAILTAQAGFQLKLAFNKQFLAQSLGSFLKIILVLVAILAKPNLLTVILAVLAGEIILAVLALFLAFPNFYKLKLTFDFGKIWDFFGKAVPIGLSLIFNLFYFRGDLIILSLFRSSAEVGNYSLAYKFFEVSLVLPIFFVNSVYPGMIESLVKSPKILAKSVSQYSAILLAISFVGSLGLFFAGPAIIQIIFGKSFGFSTLLLRILALGLPFFYLSAIYMWSLITMGVGKILLPIYAGGAFLNLLLNFILIPVWGATAAAVITVISEGVILIALYFAYFLNLRGRLLYEA